MRKIFLLSLCFFAAAQTFADEFKTTTMLSKPVGIFDTMIVTGPTVLKEVQIGAESKDPKGFLQNQSLTVNGIFGISTPITVGGVNIDLPVAAADKILIKRSLELKNGDPASSIAYEFSNIYVHPNKVLAVGNNIELNELNAESIETTQTFTEANTNAGTLKNLSQSPKAAYFKIGDRFMESPRNLGDGTKWTSIEATQGDTYGPWSALSDRNDGETCKLQDFDEYICTEADKANSGRDCTDVRRVNLVNTFALSEKSGDIVVGGAMVFDVVGRKEGHYSPNRENAAECYLDVEYSVKDANGNEINPCPNLGTTDIIKDEYDKMGRLCYAVCGDQACISTKTCYDPKTAVVTDSKINESRTKWPAGSKLECNEMWTEATFKAIRCNAGAGIPACGPGIKDAGCVKYQKRDIQCNKLVSGTSLVPGRFLVLDYNK